MGSEGGKLPKLTGAQWAVLGVAAYPGVNQPGTYYAPGTICVTTYKPALKLVELGLAKWARNSPASQRLLATDAGREALALLRASTPEPPNGH